MIKIDNVANCPDPSAAEVLQGLLEKAFPAVMAGGREACIGYLGNFPVGCGPARAQLDGMSDREIATLTMSYLTANHLGDEVAEMECDPDQDFMSDAMYDVVFPDDKCYVVESCIVPDIPAPMDASI